MAWVYTRYVLKGSPFYELETYAKLRHAGLWADAHPIAPWEWRVGHRPAPNSKPAASSAPK